MTLQQVADALRFDVPDLSLVPFSHRKMCAYPNLSVFRPGRKEFAVGTETDASDVEVTGAVRRVIKKDTAISTVAILRLRRLTRPFARPSRRRSEQSGCSPSRGICHRSRI